MMKKWMTLMAVAGVCLLWGSGCQVYKKFRTPDLFPIVVASVAVQLTEKTAEAAKFEVVVTLENPNAVALPLISSEFTLRVNGHSLMSFEDQLHITLPANGTQVVHLQGVMVLASELNAQSNYVVNGTIAYEPPGEIRKIMTESKVRLPSFGFHGEGNF